MAIETRVREKKSISPAVYVGAAVILAGAGVVAYLEWGPKRVPAQMELTPEAKAYAGKLQLSDVTMQANQSLFNQVVVEIQGKIANTGDRPVQVVEIFCVFHDSYGQLVLRQRVPIVNPRMGGLKPGETKTFRLPFDELPESWNHAMPTLVIASIRFS